MKFLNKVKALKPEKKFWLKNIEKGLKYSGGRNNFGKITIWHNGGGHKKKYWKLNFYWIKTSTGITWCAF